LAFLSDAITRSTVSIGCNTPGRARDPCPAVTRFRAICRWWAACRPLVRGGFRGGTTNDFTGVHLAPYG
jgi:hypothetical protein